MEESTIPYGKRLIVTVLDSIARSTPKKLHASIPVNDDDLSQGFRDITYAQLAAAINTAAFWLDEKLGKAPNGTFPTVAYLGLRDLRYPILVGAAVKVGRKMLLPSLLTSLEAKTGMARASKCKTFLYEEKALPIVESIQNELEDMNIVLVPELEEWLSVNDAQKYEYNKSWEEAKEDPVAIFHTSGSSGMPKLVTYTNEMFAVVDATRKLPTIDGIPTNIFNNMKVRDGMRFWPMLPLFHAASILTGFAGPVYCSYTAVLGPAHIAPTPAVADEMHRFANIDGGVYSPALLEELIANPSYQANLLKLKNIVATGAPLSKHVGDFLAQRKIVMPMIGSTEGAWWNTILAHPVAHLTDGLHLDDKLDWRDWDYFRFHPWSGATFEPALDDLYELVAVKTAESNFSMNFFKVPELKGITEFRTKDLWSPHPDPVKREKGYWRYRGRTDDLVVLTGEVKMYVGTAEDRLKSKNSMIKAVLAGGQGRKTPFLLLELRAPDSANGYAKGDNQDYLGDVWKTVEEVNEAILPQTRFKKELVLVAGEEKPFARLPKGAVDRRNTLRLYEKEIQDMYKKAQLF